jgi:hypothetical protein
VVASTLAFRDRFDSFEGAISDSDLVSSYVPVYANAGPAAVAAVAAGSVQGVFEIYTDVTDLKARLWRPLAAELAVLAGAFAATFGLLFYLLVRRDGRPPAAGGCAEDGD